MKNKNNKISVAEIDKMINEEIAKIRKVEQIKSRLSIVNEELAKLSSESVDEVAVGGTRNGSEWYEKGTPIAKFEKKGTHLKEEDPMMGDMDAMDDEIGMDDSVELEDEMGTDTVLGTFEEKMAAIGRELDAQLGTATAEDGMEDLEIADDTVEEPAGEIETTDDETAEEVPEESPEEASDESSEEDAEESEIEIDETEEGEETGEKMMNESVDRLGKKSNTLLSKELERMKRLSGL